METLSVSEARTTLKALVDRVDGTHERVTLTRNGRPAAVLISPDDLESLEGDPFGALRHGPDAPAGRSQGRGRRG